MQVDDLARANSTTWVHSNGDSCEVTERHGVRVALVKKLNPLDHFGLAGQLSLDN